MLGLIFPHCQAALKGQNGDDDDDDKSEEKSEKGRTKKSSAKQKSQTRTQSSAADGSTWSGKQIAGGLLGAFCLIIAFAAVVQRRNGTSNHAGVNKL